MIPYREEISDGECTFVFREMALYNVKHETTWKIAENKRLARAHDIVTELHVQFAIVAIATYCTTQYILITTIYCFPASHINYNKSKA